MKNSLLKMAVAVLCMTAAASAGAQMTQVPDRMFINDFSIKPGETKIVEVWFENTKPWRFLESHFYMPEGLEVVMLEKDDVEGMDYYFTWYSWTAISDYFCYPSHTFGYWAERFKDQERTVPAYELTSNLVGNHLMAFFTPLIPSMHTGIMGDGTYPMFMMKVKASEDFTGGVIEVCPDGVKYTTYSDGEMNQGESTSTDVDAYDTCGQPSRTRVTLPPVGIEDVKAAGDSRLYDLQGRVVTGTPAPGIYVKQGKKVVVE